MTYYKLLKEAERNKLIVKEKALRGYNGRIKGNRIAIKKNMPLLEKTCVLAEELGHHYTSVGNILDQSKVENRKQEKRARRWAVDRLIKVEDFIEAFNAGVQNRTELAEFLEVTEEFIDMAIDHFRSIYGYSHTIGDYTIVFSPLYVIKKFE